MILRLQSIEGKDSKSIFIWVYAGVGLMGFTLIFELIHPIISKVVQQMVDQAEINLPCFRRGLASSSTSGFLLDRSGHDLSSDRISFADGAVLVKWTQRLPAFRSVEQLFLYGLGFDGLSSNKNMILAVVLMCLLNMYSLLLSEMLAEDGPAIIIIRIGTIIAMHNIERIFLCC